MKLTISLFARTVANFPCPVPIVTLGVRDDYGGCAPLQFRIDSGADLSVIPIEVAQREHIPFAKTHPGLAQGLVGLTRKYRDQLRVQIAGQEHVWPCDFVEPPPSAASRPALLPVLGRAGFLQDYSFCLDDRFLVLTRLGPWRRWWRDRFAPLWSRLGRLHSFDQPL